LTETNHFIIFCKLR